MTRKNVGIDFHASTTSQIAIREQDGSLLIDEPLTVDTQPEPMRTAIEAIAGEVHVMFEAQTGSAWLKRLLEPHVEEVVVCHAADNEQNRGNKTDKADAKELAERLRLGDYTEVYQGSAVRTELKELVGRYRRTVDKIVRAKNQIKGLYRTRGISTPGSAVFEESSREQWLEKLEQPALRESVEQLLEVLDLYEDQQESNRKAMIREAKSHDGWESVSSLPGFGEIRTAKAIGIIGTPWRFPGKRQLWRYSCLAVVVHDSRQWHSEGPEGIVRHHEQITRGLNDDGRPELKKIFKGAAKDAIKHYPEVHCDFEARCRIKKPENAKLDIARKLASQILVVWKREEVYDPEKARWKEFSSEG